MKLEQSITINASVAIVERCIIDLDLMRCWLNPSLRCEPIGEWGTEVGDRSRFIVKFSPLPLVLENTVIERKSGLVVWEFQGFFQGRDRWECQETDEGTILLNCFEFVIPNPFIRWGFRLFALTWTQRDMQAQLQRLKRVAEGLEQHPPGKLDR
ncbi:MULTISPECIES: SRPBCC family protein [Spirulina sp. CCY15215]|uniref:SRPBCC family protein n=1 Tax=Spirulina sp. CCY15215 TaxID=2767591 RepID=UPI00194FD134|nr:SRPBCC family protein [Spirulina major]